jgi:uncharacterized protein YciI
VKPDDYADRVLRTVRDLANAPVLVERSSLVTDKHLDWLDDLRAEGTVNMWGAAPLLAEEFDMEIADARIVHAYWLKTFPRSKT